MRIHQFEPTQNIIKKINPPVHHCKRMTDDKDHTQKKQVAIFDTKRFPLS
jgi:hypothetical protein